MSKLSFADARSSPMPPETNGRNRFVPPSRRREHDVAHDGERAALDHVWCGDAADRRRVVLLKEARRVDDQSFGADDAAADDAGGATEVPMRLAGGALAIEQRGLSLEGQAEERREVPISAAVVEIRRSTRPQRAQWRVAFARISFGGLRPPTGFRLRQGCGETSPELESVGGRSRGLAPRRSPGSLAFARSHL